MTGTSTDVDEHGNPITPPVTPETAPDELTKERYKQQLEGKDALAKKQRDVITTALKDKDLAKAARLLQEAEPKVFASVMKELGHDSLESYEATLTKEPDKESLRKYFEEFENEKQTKNAKAKLDSQFDQLPEDIRETAKTKFAVLTDGRTLTIEQTESLAQDAITLAQAQHGTKHTIDYARMSFATAPISSQPAPKIEGDEVDALIKGVAQNSSSPFFRKFSS